MKFVPKKGLLLALAVSSHFARAESFDLGHTIVVEPYDLKNRLAGEPVLQENKLDKIEMHPVKGKNCGSCKHEVQFQNIPFQAELTVCKGSTGFTIYAMLHSARDSSKYNVVIKTHDSKEMTLTGKLVKINGSHYRARLILEPKTAKK